MDELELLENRLQRERLARKQAEALLEEKSETLYLLNQDLVKLAADLAEREEASRSILEATGDGIITLDESGRIDSFNRAAKGIFGYSQEQVVGQNIDKLFPMGITGEAFKNIPHMQDMERSGELHEATGRRADGSEFFMEISLSQGQLLQRRMIIVSVRDITQRKKAEEERKYMEIQLRQAQKLESIGQLAAGIAHEINTPIQFVGDNTRFLLDAFADIERLLSIYDQVLEAVRANEITEGLLTSVNSIANEIDLDYLRSEIPQAISQTLDGTDRVARIVRAMKEFSHPGDEAKSLIDINKAIQSTITVSRNEWKYDAELETDLDLTLPTVPCLASEFNQVILNIIVNAVHAIRDGKSDDSTAKGAILITTKQEGDWAKISIRDSGSGIPEAIRSKIFDPFFTTKGVGKGTGQGLAIAYSAIVDKHAGTIDVQSEVGVGTTFTIKLPMQG